jgi:1-acyl-sn-glycerol-3-phosphate acyltransferase
MAYKHGCPLLDVSLPFRIASAMTFYTLWPLAQTLNWLLYSTAYKNLRKLRGFPRAILVSNHTTFLDPVLISGAVLPRRTWQTLLEATVESPVLGTLTRLLGGIPLPRGGQGLKKLRDSAETIFRYRRFLHFYPEGECFLYNQRIAEFKPGAFWIAAELDIPVIPLVTVFSEGPRRKGRLWDVFFRRGLPREILVVLDPVYPGAYIRRNSRGEIEGESVRGFARTVRSLMQEEIRRRGGSSVFYRGRMQRIRGINDR